MPAGELGTVLKNDLMEGVNGSKLIRQLVSHTTGKLQSSNFGCQDINYRGRIPLSRHSINKFQGRSFSKINLGAATTAWCTYRFVSI